MDRLEEYLDRVCRRIGGPRAMRAHVRQELREHLLDAAAGHRAEGMSDEAAIEKALEEFGSAEEVRGELEGAHGQRMAAVVLEKALEWKEKTMKAKWLWTTWAHMALVKVILLEVLFVTGAAIFVLPKCRQIVGDAGKRFDDFVPGAETFLGVTHLLLSYWWVAAIVVGLKWWWFEKHVQSENKTFMRLSGLGAMAVIGMLFVVMMAAVMIFPMILVR